MHSYDNALGVAHGLHPAAPVTLIRPEAALAAAELFTSEFPGTTFYAVKANPSPDLLRTLWQGGVRHFDVASIAEVRLLRKTLPLATLAFMHPVKAEEAIAEAYHQHGVRIFSLDSREELAKIERATSSDGLAATDLALCVRLRVSSAHSKLSLAAKFGASAEEAPELLLETRQVAALLGVAFHVGSQAMSPEAYADAMDIARNVIVEAGVTVDIVDVGGGFPSRYPGMEPPPLRSYFRTIERMFESLPISYSAELWAEPGRALSADYASVLVRVEKRRDNELYINDGAYGSLFDAAHVAWRYPVRILRDGGAARAATRAGAAARTVPFSFYGPTCDDIDRMEGPFLLPEDVRAGDYIEIGQLGAYGQAMRTSFNGFGDSETVVVRDEPLSSHIPGQARDRRRAKIIPLRRASGY